MAPQPDTTSALALAEAARRMQLQIRTRMVRDVATVWPVLDLSRPQATWPGWLRVMLALIGRYHGESAQQAALYYRAARQLRVGDPGAVKIPSTPADQWIERALGYAGPGAYRRQTTAGADPGLAGRSALTQVLGTAARLTMDGGRATIVDTAAADKTAVGFFRVTDGNPCAFCALMASRGVVYRAAKSAGEGKQWHNDCGCSVGVAFDHDQELPAVSTRAAQVYLERGSGPALAAFRKAWNAQRAA